MLINNTSCRGLASFYQHRLRQCLWPSCPGFWKWLVTPAKPMTIILDRKSPRKTPRWLRHSPTLGAHAPLLSYQGTMLLHPYLLKDTWGLSGNVSIYHIINTWPSYLELYYLRRSLCPWFVGNYVRNTWLANGSWDVTIPSLMFSQQICTEHLWYQAQLEAMVAPRSVIYLSRWEKLI